MAVVLKLSVTRADDCLVIHAKGSITVLTVKKLSSIAEKLIEKKNLILDLREADMVTCGGLEGLVIMTAAARKKSKYIILVSEKEEVKKMAIKLELDRHLMFAGSLEEAVMKISFYS